MNMDYTTLTNEQIAEYLSGLQAEQQRRNTNQRLLDDAHRLVQAARNAGLPKAAVVNALTQVVNTYYV